VVTVKVMWKVVLVVRVEGSACGEGGRLCLW
jgi:hypothetical protein